VTVCTLSHACPHETLHARITVGSLRAVSVDVRSDAW
jgi:hypothetical protein